MGPTTLDTKTPRTWAGSLAVFLLATSLALCPLPAASQYEEAIEVDLLGRDPGIATKEPWSGWPLTVRLSVDDGSLSQGGIYTNLAGEMLPFTGVGSYLVFEDPDQCPSWDTACEGAEYDEVAVRFRPDVAKPNLSGPEEISGIFIPYQVDGSAPSYYTGPELGNTNDFYTVGASPNLPGLVIVADRGLSIASDINFDRLDPVRCRNLAGLTNSVSWEPLDTNGLTSIQALMNVPEYVFEPIVRVDADVVAPPGGSSCGAHYQVDGLPLECGDWEDAYLQPTTIRVFVVNVNSDEEVPGEAPPPLHFLDDVDGDGVCTAADAEALGYMLLSNEATTQVIPAQPRPLPFDYDGNGANGMGDPFEFVKPNAVGQLVQPPR